jgi:hypothetical protein
MSDLEKPASAGTGELCLPAHLRKPRLRRDLASEYLEFVFGIIVAKATLAKYASIGGGPAFQRVNRTPLYPREALDAWAIEKLGPLISNTSEPGVPT